MLSCDLPVTTVMTATPLASPLQLHSYLCNVRLVITSKSSIQLVVKLYLAELTTKHTKLKQPQSNWNSGLAINVASRGSGDLQTGILS